MTGLCGWIGESLTTGDAQQTLLAMSRPLHPRGEIRDSAIRAHTALATCGVEGLLSLYNDADLSVACCGRPYLLNGSAQRQRPDHGAARAIAEIYREKGVDALQSFHGCFSLAIQDRARNQTLIAVDRAGTLPMAYLAGHDGLLFGSSVTSLQAHPGGARDIALQGVFDYLYFHMVPSPGCIYRDYQKLLPGQYGLYRDGHWETDFYWQLHYSDERAVDQRELEARFHELLRCAVSDAMGNDKVGAFLSGGTDSSTVSGILSELLDQDADTYSIGFHAEGFDETEYARITSRHFGTQHHEYYVTPEDVVNAIPLIASAYDEPFGNASAIPTYYCALRAHEGGIETLLAGDGGDELFGGNSRYASQKIFELYHTLPGLLRTGVIEPLSRLPGMAALPPGRKLQSYIQQANIPLPDRLETYNFLHRTALQEIFTPEFLAGIDTDEPIEIIRDAYHRTDSQSHVNRMMHMDLKNTLADNDLRKVVRMCELAGVNVRFPLIDEAMMEFAATVPPSLQVRRYRLRYFFKTALRDFLPPEVLTKSKHGFGLPFGQWLRDDGALQSLANESLDSLLRRGYIRPDYIGNLRTLHQGEHASYYGVMIWVMMMLEQWLQTH